MKTKRHGITLIEVVVVVAILCVLLALLIPAVQSVRESARRSACSNNLHQIGLAVQSYESGRRSLPPLYNGSFLPQPHTGLDEFHFHSWRTPILTQLEESAVVALLDMTAPATYPSNQPAINSEIAVFKCPSSAATTQNVPGILRYNSGNIPTAVVGTAARSDYEAVGGAEWPVNPQQLGFFGLFNARFGAWGEPKYIPDTWKSVSYRTARFADITDGRSKTLLVAERGGRPDVYDRGKPADPYPYRDPDNVPELHQAAWAISTNFAWLVIPRGQGVNYSNRIGIFSFHPGARNAVFADGSVSFLAETTDPAVLSAMATRASGD